MYSLIRACGIASGGGSTIGEINKAIKSHELPGVELGLVIATNPNAGVIKRLRDAGYPERDIVVLPKGVSKSEHLLAECVLVECRRRDINFVGLWGCLTKIPVDVIMSFPNMMINQHPGPLSPESPPGYDFGGDKMHGERVTAARIHFVRAVGRDPWTRVVAHRVTPEFDRGEVLGEAQLDIYPETTPESLKDKRLAAEYAVQINTLRAFSEGRVVPIVRKPFELVHEDEKDILDDCKARAIVEYPNG
jgi:folate-dependent phosphoribosylglycinamide formyltransferase PurN